MTEEHQARSMRKLGPDVVVPLLVKGDKIRLKDGTRLLYGEGFDEESEPEIDAPAASTDPIPSYMAAAFGVRSAWRCATTPTSRSRFASSGSAARTRARLLRRRRLHRLKKAGRNKASRPLEPENTPPGPPSTRGRGVRWCGLVRRRPASGRPSGAAHPV